MSAGLKSDHFDAVILALPTHAAASLLAISSPELTAELAAIAYSSSITVGLGYDREVRQSLLPASDSSCPAAKASAC